MASEYKPSEQAIAFHKQLDGLRKEFPTKDFQAPNWGPQTEFMLTPARHAIMGGAAGGGKSWSGLSLPLNFVRLPWFRSVMFRREMTDITKSGALFDESRDMYEKYKVNGEYPIPNNQTYKWNWKNGQPGGARVEFSHLQHMKHIYDHKGAQYCLSYFDEADLFEGPMWWYISGRTRTTKCPMTPIQRGTCNPNPDSFIAPLIMPYFIDSEGFAIKERSGHIIWMARHPNTGEIHQEWHDELKMWDWLVSVYPKDTPFNEIPKPISFTFIYSDLADNPFLNNDGEYRASLAMLDFVEQQRQLYGNWLIRVAAGTMFQPIWIEMVNPEDVPADIQEVRGWDFAATEESPGKKVDDATSSTKLGKCKDNYCWILDNTNDKLEPNDVWDKMREVAQADGQFCQIDAPQDPGAAGKSVIATILKQKLEGFNWTSSPEKGKKSVRFSPFSAYCYRDFTDKEKPRMVKMVRGPWNQRYINQLLQFPTKGHPDDDADSTSRAFNNLFDKPAPKPSWRRNLP